MSDFVDQRLSPRVGKDLTIFVEVQAASRQDESTEDIVICQSLDLSNNGLQVALDRIIPEGRILRLCLDIKGKEPIFVVAEVVWRRQDADSQDYHVGFRLLESTGTDFTSWQQVISELVNS